MWRSVAKLALAGASVLTYGLVRPWLHPWVGGDAGPNLPRRRDDGELRIATWNVRNFPDDHDEQRLADIFEAMRADVVGLQEVRDSAAIGPLLPDHALLVSEGGGPRGQRVAIAYDPDRLQLVEPPDELSSLSLDGLVRPGLAASFRDRTTASVWTFVVVHLKARPSGYPLRRLQWSRLVEEIAALDRRGHLVVLGDFNTTGPPDASPALELRELDQRLTEIGTSRVPVVGACTAYWDGIRRDSWLEPSLLDHVFVADAIVEAHPDVIGVAGLHCARHRCAPFQSADTTPDPDIAVSSDHCPVVVDVAVP